MITNEAFRPDADELYRALLNGGRLPQLRHLTYRCHSHRCLLLDVVETPLGILLHHTRYKYSDSENEARSSEDGRQANTTDGYRHWRSRSYYLEDSGLLWPEGNSGPQTSCDHVLAYHLRRQEFLDDWNAARVEVRVRSDLSRYAL